MNTVLLVIHFFIAVALAAVILLQRSEGGALGGLGGGSGGLMSARGTANLLTRATGVLAGLFFVSSLILGIRFHSGEQKSIIDDKDELAIIASEPKKETPPAPEAKPEAEKKK